MDPEEIKLGFGETQAPCKVPGPTLIHTSLQRGDTAETKLTEPF
jgi:hypothetical protein